ncbi:MULTISPECIES: methyl-accepting chemotaxis protein [Clostridium]|uniref:methyl-accepting chemotaxis protein n=1 Tax=Clostridium TaxID=1485 RepID=UPI000824A596|nr:MULTISPECIES: methyl-accepting chemotaxis protein [Clostridium]PJI06813.1 hypothetical protein CUB90_02525 [Clostridium sp. CT7]
MDLTELREKDICEITSNLKKFTEQLTVSAREMASSAEKLAENSHSIGELANKSSNGLNKMDDIIKYIKGVSKTTNMLGINAAIESARAGEKGKGFAVVSQEIRNLAAQSKASAADIGNNLDKIKNDMNGILEVINTFTNASESQVTQADRLIESSESINEIAQELLQFIEKLKI